MQPYIENAIVHGLRHKENSAGKLSIILKKEAAHILIIIEDNGIGRKKATELNHGIKKAYQHLGMKVTGKRIDLLRMINKNKVDVNVTDIHSDLARQENGTRVSITLPVDLKFE